MSNSRTQISAHLPLMQMAENLPMAVAIFNTDIIYLFANSYWIESFQLQDQNLIGRSHYEVFPEIGTDWKAIHQRCIQGKIHRDDSVMFRRMDNSVEWLRREIRPWYAEDGSIGGLIIYAENITESKAVHDALAQQRNFLRQVIDLDTSFIFAKDTEGRFTLVNRALANAYGSTPDEMVGKYDEDYNPNRDQTRHFKRDDLEVIASRKPKFIPEEPVSNTLGETRWYQTIKIPLFSEDREDVQLLGIATDITERKRAQDELQSQRNFLRQVIDLDTSFIFAKDTEDRFTLVNQALADAYDSTPEEMVGKTDKDFNPDPDQVQNIRRDDFDVLQSHQPRFIPEEPITNARTGETRWYQTIKIPLLSEEREEVQLLGIATDITERKRAQEQLQALVIQEQQARQAAEAASRMKDLFLANMSHELRTPLNAIIGFLREMLYSNQLDDDNSHMAQRGLANGQRLAMLINSLLDLSRLAVGSLDLIATPVKLRELVTVIIEDVMIQARTADVRFELTLDPALPQVIHHDEERLIQIITNLLLNAIKYTEAGTIRLSLGLSRPERLQIEVYDTGIGIPVHLQTLVFEQFTQGETSRQKQGVGLGLSIVKNLVELMHGSIRLESEVDKFTRFSIDLPLNLIPHTTDGVRCET